MYFKNKHTFLVCKFDMNCINLKQKINRTLYCKKKKCTISLKNCANCEFKEYKYTTIDRTIHSNPFKSIQNRNKQIKNKKTAKPSKRTIATSITKEVKLTVWERDHKACIFCHKPVSWNLANSHFIKRSHGGLGIPENVFCACLNCHHKFDDTPLRKNMLPIAEKHMMRKYDNWNKDNLVYKK